MNNDTPISVDVATLQASMARRAELDRVNVQQLMHFAWLLDNDDQPRHPFRMSVLWDWADEMVRFQERADQSGEPITYYQRGRPLRTLYPTKEGA